MSKKGFGIQDHKDVKYVCMLIASLFLNQKKSTN